jgi:hypothetical protein
MPCYQAIVAGFSCQDGVGFFNFYLQEKQFIYGFLSSFVPMM